MYQVNAMLGPVKQALDAYFKAKSPVTGLIGVKFLDRDSRITLRHSEIKKNLNEIRPL